MSRAREIAEGLTPSMRDALVLASPLRHGWADLYVHWSAPGSVVRALRVRQCLELKSRQVTPLGLEVRAILQEKDHG